MPLLCREGSIKVQQIQWAPPDPMLGADIPTKLSEKTSRALFRVRRIKFPKALILGTYWSPSRGWGAAFQVWSPWLSAWCRQNCLGTCSDLTGLAEKPGIKIFFLFFKDSFLCLWDTSMMPEQRKHWRKMTYRYNSSGQVACPWQNFLFLSLHIDYLLFLSCASLKILIAWGLAMRN